MIVPTLILSLYYRARGIKTSELENELLTKLENRDNDSITNFAAKAVFPDIIIVDTPGTNERYMTPFLKAFGKLRGHHPVSPPFCIYMADKDSLGRNSNVLARHIFYKDTMKPERSISYSTPYYALKNLLSDFDAQRWMLLSTKNETIRAALSLGIYALEPESYCSMALSSLAEEDVFEAAAECLGRTSDMYKNIFMDAKDG